nr:ionotropic receptor [Semanotus bifasciatus]
MLSHTSSLRTVINLKSDVFLTGFRITIVIPVCSKYGATKSTTSSLSAVIIIAVTAKSVSPDAKSPITPFQTPLIF